MNFLGGEAARTRSVKITVKVAAVLGGLCLMLGFIALSVSFVAYNPAFYDREFEKYAVRFEYRYDTVNGTYDYDFDKDEYKLVGEGGKYRRAEWLSPEDLKLVRDKIVAYFSGRDESLQTYVTFVGDAAPSAFYEDIELSHMTDVKTVFTAARIFAYVMLPLGLALLALSFFLGPRGTRLAAPAFGAAAGAGVILAVLAVIGIAIAIDFDGAFSVFHQIFFPQGNWQFPADSRMLAVLPENLFLDAGIYIMASGLGFSVLLGAAGLIYTLAKRRKSPSALLK
ncbi:MAG: DUF1461 domain-containing protein [Clostridiales bacterium]|jgi:integral membrane protein (TIGR01906 family)|nr:DUF1461 domain-containing protein [Clostridiales bacterium]